MAGGAEERECQATAVSLAIQQDFFWKQELHLKMEQLRLSQQKMECHIQDLL